jgi:hypothetical protein
MTKNHPKRNRFFFLFLFSRGNCGENLHFDSGVLTTPDSKKVGIKKDPLLEKDIVITGIFVCVQRNETKKINLLR